MSDAMCRWCDHPESEHDTHGACQIHRRDKGIECGCVGFAPTPPDREEMC